MTDEKRLDFRNPREDRAKKPKKVRTLPVPVLPKIEIDPGEVGKADQRAIACVNMKLQGAPFHEIAKELGYANAKSANAAYIAALANMSPVEDWETLRQVEALRAETLFRRSLAMASADYLVVHGVAEDDEGNEYEYEERVPNTDRLRWHEQAGKDLALHAMITGAKAPARVEVSADTQELNQMVQALIQVERAKTPEIEMEADIWDAEVIPDGVEDEE